MTSLLGWRFRVSNISGRTVCNKEIVPILAIVLMVPSGIFGNLLVIGASTPAVASLANFLLEIDLFRATFPLLTVLPYPCDVIEQESIIELAFVGHPEQTESNSKLKLLQEGALYLTIGLFLIFCPVKDYGTKQQVVSFLRFPKDRISGFLDAWPAEIEVIYSSSAPTLRNVLSTFGLLEEFVHTMRTVGPHQEDDAAFAEDDDIASLAPLNDRTYFWNIFVMVPVPDISDFANTSITLLPHHCKQENSVLTLVTRCQLYLR